MNSPAGPDTDLYALLERFPRDDPAWNLADAFDAVTNGIENPEAFAVTETLAEPALAPWKALVRAIGALYARDPEGCRKALEDMDGAPAALKPFFRAWLTRQGTRNREAIFNELCGSCDAVVNLYRRLLIEPHPLAILAEQAEEALRHNLDEQFEQLALRIFRGLLEQPGGSLPALRYALYCLRLLDQAGYGDTAFFSLIIKTLGEADGFCALGFALIGKDDLAAAPAVVPAAVSALRKAAEAGPGTFLDGPMRALLGELIAVLEEQGGQKPPRRPPAPGRKGLVQLELFEDSYG
jgi:hypothetical protein